MGLFSSKKTYVSSVAYNIAGDADDRPNFLKQQMIFFNASGQSVGEKLPRSYLNGMGVKLRRAYKHAAGMAQGLPTASIQLWSYQDFEAAVQTLLDIEHGPGKYLVEDAYITGDSTAPSIEKYLNDRYGYDAVTGRMTNPPAGVAEDAEVSWVFEPPQNDFGNSSPQLTQSFDVEFALAGGGTTAVSTTLKTNQNTRSGVLVALVSEISQTTRSDTSESRAFIAGDTTHTNTTNSVTVTGARETATTTTVYMVTDGTTTDIRTVITDSYHSEAVPCEYTLGDGSWPTLDTIWESRANTEQTFFPSVPFRVDNKDPLDEKFKNTQNYKDTKKLCGLMGLDMHQLYDQINDNKDIKEIDYAFLVAGANMNTDSQAEMDYLFRFWELCYDRQTSNQSTFNSWSGLTEANRGKPGQNSLVIQDPQSKNGAYKITIEWNYINRSIVTGSIGKVGRHEITHGGSNVYTMGKTSTKYSVDASSVLIRKQINETQYVELTISGAVHKNDVYQGKTVETLARDARVDKEENEGFIIPLHMGVFGEMSMVHRTQLAQECLYLIFNCYQIVKKKWYQKGIFKLILAVVLVVISVISMGGMAAFSAAVWGATGIASAIGISSVLGVFIVALAVSGLSAYAISYVAGKWSAGFASVFGNKLGAIIQSVVVIVASIYAGGGKIADAFSTAQGWLQSAVRLVQAASQLFMAYVKGSMIDMANAQQEWLEQMEEKQDALTALAEDFFGKQDLVSIDYLLQLQKTLREDSPSVFLSRTLMVGSDIVDMTLGQISEMVALQTQPRLAGITA